MACTTFTLAGSVRKRTWMNSNLAFIQFKLDEEAVALAMVLLLLSHARDMTCTTAVDNLRCHLE